MDLPHRAKRVRHSNQMEDLAKGPSLLRFWSSGSKLSGNMKASSPPGSHGNVLRSHQVAMLFGLPGADVQSSGGAAPPAAS